LKEVRMVCAPEWLWMVSRALCLRASCALQGLNAL
jgi:hypothetical protein